MKVQLIVVQGKPEGKVIPLTAPVFRVGRGETCHLRPASEQVSREHAEFSVVGDTVHVKDLGSRNGTLVNGKALTGPCTLKDRDLVQIGPLTFAVSIQGAPAAAAAKPSAPAKAAAKGVSPDEISHDDIDSWLVGDSANPVPERPSGVYSGDTITVTAFKDTPKPKDAAAPKPSAPAEPAAAAPTAEDEDEYERLPEGEGDEEEAEPDSDDADADAGAQTLDEFVDESNPFYAKKKAPEAGPSKPSFKDTSDAASEILRKMMERRKGSR